MADQYVKVDQWQPIETAPTDGTAVLTYAPGKYGLIPLFSVARYHPDAGWCVDELRDVTHWMPLPDPPEVK